MATNDIFKLILRGRLFNIVAKFFTSNHEKLYENLILMKETLKRLGDYELAEKANELINILKSEPWMTERYSRVFELGEISLYEADYIFDITSSSKLYVKADVSGFYNAFGMKVINEMPDHIAVELEFLSFLYLKEAYALLNRDYENYTLCKNIRKKFCKEHLLKWVDQLADKVKKRLNDDFYAPLISLVTIILKKYYNDPK